MEGKGLLKGALLLAALSVGRMVLTGTHDPGIPADGGEDSLPLLLEEAREAQASQDRREKPLEPGEVLDPNRSGEEELDRLPGVGPRVAVAVIRHREENGAFRRPEDLLAVPGIGPATLSRIRPYLDFSGGLPPGLTVRRRDPPGVDLNRAGVEELQTLPGIGPKLAGRIVESRDMDGPFRRPEDLLRVSGIGPATLDRIRALVRVGR